VFIFKSILFVKAKNFDNLTVSIKCREFDRCFGLDCFEKLFEKLRQFSTFDRMSEIGSPSAGRPTSQGVCPPLFKTSSPRRPKKGPATKGPASKGPGT
jgi:hypothetical protein